MNTNKIKGMFALVALWLCCTSCEKLVDVDFPTNQINAPQVFETTATADGALSALYTEMQASSILSGGANGAGSLLGSYADDLDGYDTFSTNAAMDIFNNIQTPSNTTVRQIWGNAYRQIYMANAILEGLEKSDKLNEKDKNRIKAETLFMRSVIYYYLTQIYGDVPYVVATDYLNNKSLAKAAADKILNSVSEDLVAVRLLLADDYRNAERIYVNSKTLDMLLATVYVHQRKWNEAETLLNGIITSPLYDFPQDISKTFKKAGRHILWQLKPIFANAITPEASQYNFSSGLPRIYAATDDLISTFSDEDRRKTDWLTPIVSGQKTYYKIDKYKTIVANTDEYSIVFRLQEAYLLMAEVLAEKNEEQKALGYLNTIRRFAGLSDIVNVVSMAALKDEIVKESRREFFSERGLRFLMLKRQGKLGILSNRKPNWKLFHTLWPLPISELTLNKALNPQNTGY